MTLALFVCAILIALLFARYNGSNKLFWTLFVSLTLGIAGVKVLSSAFDNKEQSEQSLDQAYPTQALPAAKDTCLCFFDNAIPAPKKETSKPVSKANTPDYIESLCTLSDVSGVTQSLYLHVLPNPPNKVAFHDTS